MQMVKYVIRVLWDVILLLDEWFRCSEGMHYLHLAQQDTR
jgi:hypothetical protein